MSMLQTFSWPVMEPACFAYMRQYPECARKRVNLRLHTTELQLFPPTAPLLLGPFPTTKSGNIHLLLLTYLVTRLRRTIPLRHTREFEVANAFAKHWTFVYGARSSKFPIIFHHLAQRSTRRRAASWVSAAYSPTLTIRAPMVRPSDLFVLFNQISDRTFCIILIFGTFIPTQ